MYVPCLLYRYRICWWNSGVNLFSQVRADDLINNLRLVHLETGINDCVY